MVFDRDTLFSDYLLGGDTLYWTNKALAVYLVGLTFLWLGYRSRLADRLALHLGLRSSAAPRKPTNQLVPLGLLVYALGALAILLRINLGMYHALGSQEASETFLPVRQFLVYLESSGRYGIVLLTIAWLVQRSHAAKISLFLVIPIDLLFGLVSGYRTYVVQSVFFLGATIWYLTRRMAWQVTVGTLLFLVVIDPLLNVYRVTPSGSFELKGFQVLSEKLKGLPAGVPENPGDLVTIGSMSLLKRVYYLQDMAKGLWYADNVGKLEDTSTFLARPFVDFIPRFIWPGKPRGELGRVFNVEVARSTEVTASSPLLPGWLYMETGLSGLVLYFFFGLLLRTAYRFYYQSQDLSRLFRGPLLVWILALNSVWDIPFSWFHSLFYQLLVLAVVRRVAFKIPGAPLPRR